MLERWDSAFAAGAARQGFESSPLFHSAGLAASPGRSRASIGVADTELPLLPNEAPGAAAGLSGGLDQKPGGAASADAENESALQSTVKALLYGLINTIVVTPVMIGFAAIIFRHNAFHRDPAVYSQLVKLVLFSSAVHQTAFTTTSTLPFARNEVPLASYDAARLSPLSPCLFSAYSALCHVLD